MKNTVISALVAFVLLPAFVQAEEVATVPEGYMSYSLAAGTVAAPKLSSFSVPLRNKAGESFVGTSSGKITGVTSNTLTVAGAGWATSPVNAMAQTGSPFFIRIKNGASAEGHTFLITANTVDTVTVSSSVNLAALSLVLSGEGQSSFEIFPGDTLLSFFGNGTIDGALSTTMGGNSAANADIVRINDGNGFRDYYFHQENNRWQEGGFNRNTTVLFPHMGITYLRKAATPLDMVITGVVPDTGLKAFVKNSGASYISLPFPVDMTLLNSGLQNMPGFVKGLNSGEADNINVWDGNGWRTYFYHSTNNRWQEGGFNRNTTVIPAGKPVWVIKKGVATGSTIWDFAKPYALN